MNPKAAKAVRKLAAALKAAQEASEALSAALGEDTSSGGKTTAAAKPPKAKKEKKVNGNPKALAQAVLDSGKFDGRSKEAKALKELLDTKVDGRSKEGKELLATVAPLIGIDPPKKPGPKKGAKAKAEKAPKSERKPKAEKAPKEKKAKAAKTGGSLKDKAQAALDNGKFDGRSKEGKALQEFLEVKDGRSKEARELAAQVAELLGEPTPRKPGPKKGTKPGKGEADDAKSEAPKPSPKTKSSATGAKPRMVDAVKAIVAEAGSLNAAEVVSALEAKGWMPSSNDPKSYISFVLSQNKDEFERDPSKGRGYYRIKGSETKTEPKTNGKSEAKSETKAAKPEPEAKASPDTSDSDEEEEAINPFDEDGLARMADEIAP